MAELTAMDDVSLPSDRGATFSILAISMNNICTSSVLVQIRATARLFEGDRIQCHTGLVRGTDLNSI